MKKWRLKSNQDRRFKTGHPWVYSNELQESPKGINPGEAIELCDAGGKFLARGYGNPQSLIAFRELSRNESEPLPFTLDWALLRLQSAIQLRKRLGLTDFSHRVIFGEADRVPGLILDHYLTPRGDVWVLQAHTAGADQLISFFASAIQKEVGSKFVLISKNDVSVRELEGVPLEKTKIIYNGLNMSEEDLKNIQIKIRSAGTGLKPLQMSVDLWDGQKTGFFLDQLGNIELSISKLGSLKPKKILDLCSYVGHWGAQWSNFLNSHQIQPEVSAVDASKTALDFCKKNVEAAGGHFVPIKGDVLADLPKIESNSFDLVICDPPALIKGRKNIGPGAAAYLKLNTEVFRIVKNGGGVVSCSCSGLYEEETMIEMLNKAARRNSAFVSWVARGTQASDHPVLSEFPEGRYLKAWMGIVEKSN